ncbi:hypothetical protein INT43_000304 [Umbelopsis isabellina]|uniref:Uncharacterized protein n=1 Tax=Mortierella isabellina TaxID=91625 RepID=A0A8H7Q317_MORIS|nr:hypothetical protein INT43_000304 [Umbelopsis isabellina]
MKIEGSVAIITGAASGMGKTLAEKLVSLGGKVLIADRDVSQGSALAEALNKEIGSNVAVFHETDVTKWKTLEAAFEKAKDAFGKINIVVNNAGITESSSWFNDNDAGEESCEYMTLNINLVAVAKGTRLALKYFAQNPQVGEGVVISTSSLYGLYNSGIVPLYAAAKAGVVSLVRSHSLARKETNTRHVALCPWFIDTPLLEGTFREALTASSIPVIPQEPVIDAFIQAIEDDTLNGAVLTVFPGGTEIIRENIYSGNADQLKMVRAMETSIIEHQYALAKEARKL